MATIVFGMFLAMTYYENGGGLGRDTVIVAMISSYSGLILSFCLFLLTIKRCFVWTFFDWRTINEYLQENFKRDEATDETKFYLFTKNEAKWKKAIGEEVKAWLEERLPVGWRNSLSGWMTTKRLASLTGHATTRQPWPP